MKRVKAACILQTLIFQQKEDCGLSREAILSMNRGEINRYKESLERTHTRHQIISEENCKTAPFWSGFGSSTTTRQMSANTSSKQQKRHGENHGASFYLANFNTKTNSPSS